MASGAAGPTVLSDTDNEVLNLALTDTSNQASVALTATAPPGFDLASEVLISHYSDFSSIALSSGTPDSATETLIAPFFSEAPLSVYVRADPTAPGVDSTTVGWSVGLAPGETDGYAKDEEARRLCTLPGLGWHLSQSCRRAVALFG